MAAEPKSVHFGDVSTALNNERRFVSSEKQLIRNAYETLNDAAQKMMQTTWLWRKRQQDMRAHFAFRAPIEDWAKRFFEIRHVCTMSVHFLWC